MTAARPTLPAAPLPPDCYLNRELALIQFQRRVLAQAADPAVPLLERLRFLCIVSSNLDEFFEVRVASLKQQIRDGVRLPSIDGLLPAQQLEHIREDVQRLIEDQYALLNEHILPALAAEGIVFLRRDELTAPQRDWVHRYFLGQVQPVLTPIGLDPAHPFPRILNKSLNFAVELEGQDAYGRTTTAAIVQAPRALPRIIALPPEICTAPHTFIFLSSVVHAHVQELFPGMTVRGCHQFRITRDADLYVEEDEVKDLRASLAGELSQRNYGAAVRLEIAATCPPATERYLLEHFSLTGSDIYRMPGIVNMVRLSQAIDLIARPDLLYPPIAPGLPKALANKPDLFALIAKQDILLHHPYQSFAPVIDLLRSAADDPNVLAIKMTIYRTGNDSVLMEHLARAAQKGKEVTVVLELMARFDEEANINWATRLEEVGAHVVYGVFGYKTHAKMLLIVRRENGALRRYAHLGTGNYHPRTTRLYTDFGLLTAHPGLCADVAQVFNHITGAGHTRPLTLLWQAPFTLHSNILAAIARETEHARAGRRARITAKMNALLEPQVIAALYTASQAGVQIQLIVRGPCALRPNVPGLSDNIRVRSIVGRYLEHHRIYHFHNNGEDQVWLASADWMGRNFFRRTEIAYPILDRRLKRRIIREGLRAYLADNTNAWEMQPNGHYRRKFPHGHPRTAQRLLQSELAGDNPSR